MLRKRMVLITAVGLLVCLGSAGYARQRQGSLPGVAKVDLKRYTGTWYEIARLPAPFQRDCVLARANYSVGPDGRILVLNEGLTASGKVRSIRGEAEVLDPGTNARLFVSFGPVFKLLKPFFRNGNYVIIDLDPEYRTSLVGTPDRRYLWILARERFLPEEQYRHLVAIASRLGFSTGRMIRADWSGPQGSEFAHGR